LGIQIDVEISIALLSNFFVKIKRRYLMNYYRMPSLFMLHGT